MNEIEALQAELNGSIAEFKAIGEKLTDPNYEATADERSRFDELDRAIAAGQEKIEAIRTKMETDSERSARLNRLKEVTSWKEKIDEEAFRRPNQDADFRGADMDSDLNVALAAWARFGCAAVDCSVSEQEFAAGRRLGVNVAAGEFRVANPQIRAAAARQLQATYAVARGQRLTAANVVLDGYSASSSTDALDSRVPDRAGYLNRGSEVLNTLEMNMIAYGGILQSPVTIMVTDHYEDVVETYGDDSTRSGRQIGEGQTIGATNNPSFATITWKHYTFTSDDILVNNMQLERSRYALPSYIPTWLGERLGRVTGTKCTTGTGAVTPMGIQTATTAGGTYVTTAASPTIAYNDLVDLQHVLDPIYWNAPGTGWMMHPKVLPLLKKIKDGQGLPILNLGKEGSGVATLLGQSIYWNNDMTSPSSGTWTSGDKAIIYGQFPRFVIRRAGGGVPVFIRDETTGRRTLQTYFTALMYMDSQLRDYGANPLAEMRIA